MCQVLMLMGNEMTPGCYNVGVGADCNRLWHHQGVFGLELLYIDLLIRWPIQRSIMPVKNTFHQLTCNGLSIMSPLIPPCLR